MKTYVIDTHALVWYTTKDTRIGNNTKAVIEQCEAGQVQVILPAIVLIETISILRNPKKGYNKFNSNINILLDWLKDHPQFQFSELNFELIKSFNDNLSSLQNLRDDHDRLIVITSQMYGNIPIITKDEKISALVTTTTIW